MYKKILTTGLVIATNFFGMAQDAPHQPIPYNESRYFSSLPLEESLRELCQTAEGRQRIIANLDSLSRQDLNFQWQGAILQREPTEATFEAFLEKYIEMRCSSPGYQFSLEPTAQWFYYGKPSDGGYVPANKLVIHCWSGNEDGGDEMDCHLSGTSLVPDGWQACKVKYDSLQRRHGRFKVRPDAFMPGDNTNPRFKGYHVSITGHGDQFNPSYVYLINFRIFALRESATIEDRKRCGCDFPLKPAPPNPVTSQTATASPAKFEALLRNNAGATGMTLQGSKATFVIGNIGGKPGEFYCEIEFFDTSQGKWRQHAIRNEVLKPNEYRTEDLSINYASAWRIVQFQQVGN